MTFSFILLQLLCLLQIFLISLCWSLSYIVVLISSEAHLDVLGVFFSPHIVDHHFSCLSRAAEKLSLVICVAVVFGWLFCLYDYLLIHKLQKLTVVLHCSKIFRFIIFSSFSLYKSFAMLFPDV